MISAFGVEHDGISKGMRLPSGARVRFRTKMTHRKRTAINYETGEPIPAGSRQFHKIEAKVKGKKVGGMFIYHGQPLTHGMIGGLETDAPLRRQGLATGMMRHMEERSPIPIRHSNSLTDDGRAFATKRPISKAGRKDTLVFRQPADTDIYPNREHGGRRSPTSESQLGNKAFVNGKQVRGDAADKAHAESYRRASSRWAKASGAYQKTTSGGQRVNGNPATNAGWSKSKYVPLHKRPPIRAAGKVGATAAVLGAGGYAVSRKKS